MANVHKKGLGLVLFLSIIFLCFGQIKPEFEPNNSTASAQGFNLGDTLSGRISSFTDVDYFKITLPVGAYQLSTFYPGGEPRNRDWFELLGPDGKEIPSVCFYPGGGVHLAQFKICTQQEVYFKALANTDFGLSNRSYAFTIRSDNGNEQECNDQFTSAKVIKEPGEVQGKINIRQDVDWIKLSGVKAGIVSMSINAPGSNIPFSLALYDNPTQNPMAVNNGRSDLNTSVVKDGDYYLAIKYADDTASMFPYRLALIYTPTSDTCEKPAIGVIRNVVDQRKVTVETLINNADSLLINWGDGTQSDTLSHEYAQNGTYNIELRAINRCSVAIAETKVSILTAKFELGKVKNVLPNTIVKVPLISREGEFPVVGVIGTVQSDKSIAEWVGFESGTVEVRNITSNLSNGQFAGVFSPNGNETSSIGDTLFYVLFKISATARPGDSTSVDLNGALAFTFSAFLNGETFDVPTTLIPGSITLVKNITLRVNIKTADGESFPYVYVKISSGGGSKTFQTDRFGNLEAILSYSDHFEVVAFKDTIFLSGLSPVDVFLLNRILVGLPNPGLSKSSIYGGDYNCDGKLSVLDGVAILQQLVGLLSSTNCTSSVKFIPKDYIFPAYPANNYFQVPNSINIHSPNPDKAINIDIEAVISGDLNKSWHYSGLRRSEDEPELDAQWKASEAILAGEKLQITLSPEEKDLVGGVLELQFDAQHFDFHNLELEGFQWALNANQSSQGKLKLAFAKLGARSEGEIPNVVLNFKKKRPQISGDALKLDIKPSIVIDKEGRHFLPKIAAVQNSHLATPPQIKIYPNPVSDVLRIEGGFTPNTMVMLQDALGKTIFKVFSPQHELLEIPVKHLPAGNYFLHVNGKVEKVQIQK